MKNAIKIRIIRVMVFYTVILVSLLPMGLVLIGTIGMLTNNNVGFLLSMILSSSGYVYNVLSLAISGILVPLYIVKLNKEKDWSCKFLMYLFLTSLSITVLYFPLCKIIMCLSNR